MSQNGHRAFNRRHLARSLLGLTVPSGERFVHPDHRPGARSFDDAPSSFHRDAPDADSASSSRDRFDASVYDKDFAIRNAVRAREGRASLVSFGFTSDLWFALVNEYRWATVVALEVGLEVALIAACGLALWVIARLEDAGSEEERGRGRPSFRSKILLALTTVRLSTDSIYGWRESDPSSAAEVFVLACFGWAHWFVLSIASALIVARALRPQKALAFAPDMVVTPNDGAQIRFMPIRGSGLSDAENQLVNVDFRVQFMCDRYLTHDMTLARSSYAAWPSFDVGTLTVTLEGSPFDPKLPDGERRSLQQVLVTMQALDLDGNQAVARANYYRVPFEDDALERAMRPYPRILFGHKFVDCYRIIRDPTTGAPVRREPKFCCDLDNFVKTEPADRGDVVAVGAV